MTKPYLILINGVLAERRLTFVKAKQRVQELSKQGYKLVSLAEDK